jgi:hypothetical protein
MEIQEERGYFLEERVANLESLFAEFQQQISETLKADTFDISCLYSQLNSLASQLEKSLTSIPRKIDEAIEIRFAEFQQQFQSLLPGNELIIGRSGSKKVLNEALEKTHEQLILVCPWLNRKVINAEMIQKFKCIIDWGSCISIGWGYPDNMKHEQIKKGFTPNELLKLVNDTNQQWKYDALNELKKLESDYPERFTQSLRVTHEKFLVCDRSFAMVTTHNFLTSGDVTPVLEVGIRTTDQCIIQGLINQFEHPPAS